MNKKEHIIIEGIDITGMAEKLTDGILISNKLLKPVSGRSKMKIKRLRYRSFCPCGSGLRYGRCCMNKVYINRRLDAMKTWVYVLIIIFCTIIFGWLGYYNYRFGDKLVSLFCLIAIGYLLYCLLNRCIKDFSNWKRHKNDL